MAQFINQIKGSVIVWSLVVFCAGAIFGVIGMKVESRNVRLHGASYSNYEFEFLTLLSLPGEAIVEHRLERDSQLGEIALQHTKDVVFQNAKIYGLSMLMIGIFIRLYGRFVNPPQQDKLRR